jgi:hypothetical protein
MDPEPPIGLPQAIRSLRSELALAMQEGEGEDLRFTMGPVELEFLVQVTRARTGEAGVKFWVVSLGGSAGVTDSATHRVKLSLLPVTAGGESVMVGDEVARRPRTGDR